MARVPRPPPGVRSRRPGPCLVAATASRTWLHTRGRGRGWDLGRDRSRGLCRGHIRGLGRVVAGILFGVAPGVVAGIAFRVRISPIPARGIRWQTSSPGDLVASVLTGVLIGVATGYELGVWAGVLLGVLAGATGGAMACATKGVAPLDINSAMSPPAVLARDRRTVAVYGTLTGAALGVLAWFWPGPRSVGWPGWWPGSHSRSLAALRRRGQPTG